MTTGLLVALLAQSDPPSTDGSDTAVFVISVLVVTIVIAVVVARRARS
jgi:hypothetical protein